MNIVIKRIRVRPETIDGHLYIDGTKICDTAECATKALPEGEYEVSLIKCKQYKKNVLCLEGTTAKRSVTGDEVSGQWNGRPICLEGSTRCDRCPQMKWVFYDTTLPVHCPMLKIGNGVYNRPDGSIIVGKYLVPGCVLHSKDAYNPLFQRIRKSIERGNSVTLKIMNQ